MGRLAVILGSSATGPAGGESRRGSRTARGCRPAAPRLRRRLRAPPPHRPRRQPALAGRRRLRPGAGDLLGRLARCRAGGRQLRLSRTTSSPCSRPSPPSTTRAATRRRDSTRPGASEVLTAWAASGAGDLRDGGVYWQTNGPRFETPAEIRADRRPRRPGRDDAGLGVHRRRRAGAALRGGLRGRQPRQRDRGRDRSPPPSWSGDRESNAMHLARRPRRRPAGAGATCRRIRAHMGTDATRTSAGGGGRHSRRRDGRAALRATGAIAAIGPEVVAASPATRRSTPVGRRWSPRWSTATPTRR